MIETTVTAFAVLFGVFLGAAWGSMLGELVARWRERRRRAMAVAIVRCSGCGGPATRRTISGEVAVAVLALSRLETIDRLRVATEALAGLPPLPQEVSEPLRVLVVQAKRWRDEQHAVAVGGAS